MSKFLLSQYKNLNIDSCITWIGIKYIANCDVRNGIFTGQILEIVTQATFLQRYEELILYGKIDGRVVVIIKWKSLNIIKHKIICCWQSSVHQHKFSIEFSPILLLKCIFSFKHFNLILWDSNITYISYTAYRIYTYIYHISYTTVVWIPDWPWSISKKVFTKNKIKQLSYKFISMDLSQHYLEMLANIL